MQSNIRKEVEYMGILSELEPTKVFHYFEEICSIPHGSGNVKQISDYLADFAKSHDLKYRQDEKYNVIIWKAGSKGYEASEPVILQGHMDMVAVKTDGCEKNLEKEGLTLEVDGDFISARDTSLGGDDGIAVAYALAILADDTILHPPIEAVFTVDEEIGMLGADYLEVSDLKGRTLLNIDSEDEGIFTVSCAGGATVSAMLPSKKEPVNAAVIEIRIDGLFGGHSGVEIHKGRLNANCAMGRILLNVFQNIGMRIVTVNGGEKDNAIANFSEAAVVVLPETVERARKIIEDTFAEIKAEYSSVEKNARIRVNVMESRLTEAFSDAATLATVIALVNMPEGIQRMNPDVEGMVQTSLNLGVLRTKADQVKMSFCVRSSSDTEKKFLIDKIRSLTEIFGGSVEITGNYTGWEYRPDSKLREVMVQTYRELYGKEPVVEGIHAGLECGIFSAKLPELDAVSFGPQMYHIHTTDEKLSISSTRRTWELLLRVLEKLK